MPRDQLTPCTVLLSGGIDSCVVLALMTQEMAPVSALFIDYGQPAAGAERQASQAVAAKYGVDRREVAIRGVTIPPSGEIRGRNDMLIAVALAAVPDSMIAIGTHAGTGYADCTDDHAIAWQSLLDGEYVGCRRLLAPLISMRKADVLSLALTLEVPLADTYSCEAGTDPCLNCRSCRDRELIDATS